MTGDGSKIRVRQHTALRSPSKVTTLTREPNDSSGSTITLAFSDALGRVLQQQHEAIVEGTWTGVATSAVKFDAVGNAVQRYAPFQMQAFNGVYAAPSASAAATTLQYDALGRATRTTSPDGTYRTADYSVAWQTTAMDECFNAAGCQGATTVEIRDGLGR